MDSVQNRARDHRAASGGSGRTPQGNELPERLVRSRLVEVAAVLDEHLEQMLLTKHEHVVETLPAHAPKKSLTHGVCPRCLDGGFRILAPTPRATRSKSRPNLSSRSRIRIRGPTPKGVALRICCATHVALGSRVTPTWRTLREPRSMMKNAKIGRREHVGREPGARPACA
jgi:hypothetical protein